jgi:hypothetical protein
VMRDMHPPGDDARPAQIRNPASPGNHRAWQCRRRVLTLLKRVPPAARKL